LSVSQQQINQIRRFSSTPQTPDSVITPSCTESVTFTPNAFGNSRFWLTFADDSGGGVGILTNHGGSSNDTQTLKLTGTGIIKTGTTTSITSVTPNRASLVGEPVTVSFSVAPEAGTSLTPSGAVTIMASTGETCIGSGPSGSCLLTFPTVGARTIVATYSGDDNFTSSTSTSVSQNAVDFAITISPAS
jgi:hypothetical protein